MIQYYNLTAQDKNGEIINDQFKNFQLSHFTEKVFVHLDKDFFFAGERVFFKIYDLEGYTNKPIGFSAVMSVELVSQDQRPVIQFRIPLDSTTGYGSFEIPKSLRTGNYTFRVYSSWMQNFSPDLYYHQNIMVVNTSFGKANIPTRVPDTVTLEFFPEGGNFVNDLQSKVGFKATDHNGKAIAFDGFLLDQKNDTVAKINTLKFGLGHFLFTPGIGVSYHVVESSSKFFARLKMGKIFEKGVVMSLKENTNNQLSLIITEKGMQPGQKLYFFMHFQGLVKKIQYETISNGKTEFNIRKDELSEGVNHFTIFDSSRKPLCERLYFKPPAAESNLTISSDKSIYTTRSLSDLSIKFESGFSKTDAANLSLSVFLLDSFQNIPENNIYNYLLLSSELKGHVDSVNYYFGPFNPEKNEAVENLMLTQGWVRFKWEDILNSQPSAFEFLPELHGSILKGRIIDKISGKPVKDMSVYLAAPGRQVELMNSISDEFGDVYFHVKNGYGRRAYVAVADSNVSIEIQTPFSEKFSNDGPYRLFDFKALKDQLLSGSINAQAEDLYGSFDQNKITQLDSQDSLSFYGIPDKHYNLDDYTRFQTVEEVLREYVSEVRVRTKSDKFLFRVFDKPNNVFFDLDPLVLIDGVPVTNLNKLIKVDPIKIKTIDLVTNKYFLNGMAVNGIVNFKTYEGDLNGYEIDPGDVVFKYEALHSNVEYYSPDYSKPVLYSKRIPDFRNLLNWKPSFHLHSAEISHQSFFTSDLTGNFVAIVQGLSLSGQPLFALTHFMVTN